MPRMKRPPDAAWVVSACWASIIGCRGYVGTTAVPSSMRGTSRPTIASVEIASMPKICGSQYDANPSASVPGVGDDVVDRAVDSVAAEDADVHGSLPSSASATGPFVHRAGYRAGALLSSASRTGYARSRAWPAAASVAGQTGQTGQAGVTQLVECNLAKVDVAGSNPVSRSTIAQRSRGAEPRALLRVRLLVVTPSDQPCALTDRVAADVVDFAGDETSRHAWGESEAGEVPRTVFSTTATGCGRVAVGTR